jgi:hypothetical protein
MLERLASDHEDLIRRFLFEVPRNESEIIAAEEEFSDRVSYNFRPGWLKDIEAGIQRTPSKYIMTHLRRRIRECEEKYEGQENLVCNDFELRMINGKLSALRWVLGDEWDFLLDT